MRDERTAEDWIYKQEALDQAAERISELVGKNEQLRQELEASRELATKKVANLQRLARKLRTRGGKFEAMLDEIVELLDDRRPTRFNKLAAIRAIIIEGMGL